MASSQTNFASFDAPWVPKVQEVIPRARVWSNQVQAVDQIWFVAAGVSQHPSNILRVHMMSVCFRILMASTRAGHRRPQELGLPKPDEAAMHVLSSFLKHSTPGRRVPSSEHGILACPCSFATPRQTRYHQQTLRQSDATWSPLARMLNFSLALQVLTLSPCCSKYKSCKIHEMYSEMLCARRACRNDCQSTLSKALETVTHVWNDCHVSRTCLASKKVCAFPTKPLSQKHV